MGERNGPQARFILSHFYTEKACLFLSSPWDQGEQLSFPLPLFATMITPEKGHFPGGTEGEIRSRQSFRTCRKGSISTEASLVCSFETALQHYTPFLTLLFPLSISFSHLPFSHHWAGRKEIGNFSFLGHTSPCVSLSFQLAGHG